MKRRALSGLLALALALVATAGRAEALNATTGSPYSVASGSQDIAYSPDGHSLVLAGTNGLTLYSVDASSGALTPTTNLAVTGGATVVTFSPDSGAVAILNGSGVSTYSVSGTSLVLVSHVDLVNGWDVDFSPDGSKLAVSEYNSRQVAVLSVGTDHVLSNPVTTATPTLYPRGISFGPNGVVATADYIGSKISTFTVDASNALTGEQDYSTDDGPTGVDFSPDGTKLVDVEQSASTMRLWQVQSGGALTQVATLPLSRAGENVGFGSDNTTVAAGTDGGPNLAIATSTTLTSAGALTGGAVVAIAPTGDVASLTADSPPKVYVYGDVPTASITAPVTGAGFVPNQSAQTGFTCAPGGTHAIATCLDGAGQPSGSSLDTSGAYGAHTLTVTATNDRGRTGQATRTYYVADVPTDTVTTPATNAVYPVGAVVRTAFTCADGQGGPGMSTCVDGANRATGATLDTTSLGAHSLSVIGTSRDGLSHQVTVSYTVVARPTIAVGAPTSTGAYAVGQDVTTSFTCTDGAGAPGLTAAGCQDGSGRASGATLDTAAAGPHRFTITATSQDGGTTTVAMNYQVGASPTVSVSAPTEGAVYGLGQVVRSSFTCAEGSGGPGVSACQDDAGASSGTALDTSTLGAHTVTMQATSRDGLTSAPTVVHYRVDPLPAASIAAPAAGAVIGYGVPVSLSFACSPGSADYPVTSCTEVSGLPTGSTLDTTTLGAHALSVTATTTDGLSSRAAATYTVVPAPTVLVTTPLAGATYLQGTTVTAGYGCSEGPGGPGLSSCSATGAGPSGAPLDTAAPGVHTVEVSAVSADGAVTRRQVTYTVVAHSAPLASIDSPGGGGVYGLGAVVPTRFHCAQAANGSAIVSCVDDNPAAGDTPDAGVLDTATAGPHDYSVSATDADGRVSTATLSYLVLPAGALSSSRVRIASTGLMTMGITTNQAGRVSIRVRHHRFTWARQSQDVSAGLTRVRIAPTAADLARLASLRRSFDVVVKIVFRPLVGAPTHYTVGRVQIRPGSVDPGPTTSGEPRPALPWPEGRGV